MPSDSPLNLVASPSVAASMQPMQPMQAMSTAAPSAAAPVSQQQLLDYAATAHKSALALNYPWLAHLFAGFFLVSAVLLIVLLAVQTTKQEGLSGSVGGRVEASYRMRPGMEQQLANFTTFIAMLFVVSATLVSLSGF